jgi:uncharacterized 2Fe-2S/4Fe-4S cluster protein (DUF4445 family)
LPCARRSTILIDKVCKEGEIERGDILDAVFVGNPIMHHLFLGIDPTELGGAPFALAVSGAVNVKAEIDIPLNPGAGSICCPASPAMSAPTRPQRHSPKARTARTR